jgi:predicted deacylase
MAKNTIEISGIKAKPGTLAKGKIKVGERHDGKDIEVPLLIVNGSGEGPTLLLESGAHADELIGTVSSIRLATDIDPSKVKGTLVVISVANMGAYLTMSRHNNLEFPQGADLGGQMRLARGAQGPRSTGTLTERNAAVINDIYNQAKPDCIITLHSSAKESYNFARGLIAGTYVPMSKELREKTDKLAIASGWEVIYRPTEKVYPYMYFPVPREPIPELKQLRMTLETGKAPTLIDIETMYTGLKNVMIHLGMISGKIKSCVGEGRKQVWVDKLCALNANKGGLFISHIEPGAHVKKGQKIGKIINLFNEVQEEIKAPYDGIVVKIQQMAFTTTGIRCFVLVTPYGEAK